MNHTPQCVHTMHHDENKETYTKKTENKKQYKITH